MQEMILDLCRQLRLGAHIADIYKDIQADTHEEFLLQLLT